MHIAYISVTMSIKCGSTCIEVSYVISSLLCLIISKIYHSEDNNEIIVTKNTEADQTSELINFSTTCASLFTLQATTLKDDPSI